MQFLNFRLKKTIWSRPYFWHPLANHPQDAAAAIAQLEKRQNEDLKVPGSIPGRGNPFSLFLLTTTLLETHVLCARRLVIKYFINNGDEINL